MWLSLAFAVLAVAETPVEVRTVGELVAAVKVATPGTTVTLAEETFALDSSLELPAGVTLRGAGVGKTILTGVPDWEPPTATLPDPEMTRKNLDESAYLVKLRPGAAGVTISHLTLHASKLHGAVYGVDNKSLHLHHLGIDTTQWCGVRTFSMTHARVHDCEFHDAGGRWERGRPGTKGGITGGAIFAIWMADCDIAHNRFTRSRAAREHEFYGVKVRQAKRCRVHHNTIDVNFSIEMPFENDEDNEIDHNVCSGTVSIPKHAGGPVPKSGRTFRLHHNLFRDSYSIEFVRNGVEIDHNRFAFDAEKDHGNLISGFGKAPAGGPASFHNNLVSAPGRGVIWLNEPYNNLTVRNNEIRTTTTKTPRTEGLFGLNPETDFSTVAIRDNVITCEGTPRPLVRNAESTKAKIENNTLVNVSDQARYANPPANRKPGLESPLAFQCGVHGETTVTGWDVTPTPAKQPPR